MLANRKRVCGFLLVRHSNLGHILHRFGDIARFVLLTPPLFHPNFGVFPLHQIARVGSANKAEALRYSAVKLLSKYSNLCEKHTSTSQTDTRTDDLLWH